MNTKEIKLINRLIENHSYQYALNTIESIISKGNDKEAFIFGIYLLHHMQRTSYYIIINLPQ